MKTQSRTPAETALTCSPNSQLMLLFLVKSALELTELLARDHGSNNTIMPGSSSSRRRQSSEEGGLSPRRVSVRRAACGICLLRGGRAPHPTPPLPSTRLCDRRDLAQGPNERLHPFFPPPYHFRYILPSGFRSKHKGKE